MRLLGYTVANPAHFGAVTIVPEYVYRTYCEARGEREKWVKESENRNLEVVAVFHLEEKEKRALRRNKLCNTITTLTFRASKIELE